MARAHIDCLVDRTRIALERSADATALVVAGDRAESLLEPVTLASKDQRWIAGELGDDTPDERMIEASLAGTIERNAELTEANPSNVSA